jgi:glycosyltransferase involved in cell wall biosynthesis
MYPEPKERQLADVEAKYQLKRPFIFYPAVTWPHKNHIRLFHALVRLRETAGLRISLICTGYQDPQSTPAVFEAVKRLNLSDQVRFLGLLPEGDMRSMYRLAESLVLPSLFEADSCPIHEAWVEGLPVVCSNRTAIPDQVRDAGVLFDATDVDSIANALARVHNDAQLRKELARRGYERVSDFSWERTAMAYRAVYRRAARQTLSEEDRHLLGWDWMREPRRLSAEMGSQQA